MCIVLVIRLRVSHEALTKLEFLNVSRFKFIEEIFFINSDLNLTQTQLVTVKLTPNLTEALILILRIK